MKFSVKTVWHCCDLEIQSICTGLPASLRVRLIMTKTHIFHESKKTTTKTDLLLHCFFFPPPLYLGGGGRRVWYIMQSVYPHLPVLITLTHVHKYTSKHFWTFPVSPIAVFVYSRPKLYQSLMQQNHLKWKHVHSRPKPYQSLIQHYHLKWEHVYCINHWCSTIIWNENMSTVQITDTAQSSEMRPCLIIIIIINQLTARVVGAPQTILQPVFSIFPCSLLPSETCRTPGLSIP